MKKLSRRDFVKTTSLASAAVCTSAGLGSRAVAADSAPGREDAYQSEWHRVPDRYWTGPNTWANPWEDWQIQRGRLVCTKAARGNRTVHCLTHQLDEAAADAQIAVTVEYCAPKSPNETGVGLVDRIGQFKDKPAQGSAGFELGIRVNDPIDDYRSRLLFGKGLPVGINGRGELFIGRRDRKQFPELAAALAAGEPVRLVGTIRPDQEPGLVQIELAATTKSLPASQSAQHYAVVKKGVPAKDLAGNVALVNNVAPKTAGDKSLGLFAFSNWTLGGPKVAANPEQSFGPVLWTLYTLSGRVMKLTAQMPPLGEADEKEVRLQTKSGEGWKTVATATIDPLACTATFRVSDWDDSRDTPYRVAWTQAFRDGKHREFTYSGTIRKDPKDKPELVVAGYCCFFDFLFPNTAIAGQSRAVDPDIMFFVGDQLYEPVGGFGILRDGDLKRMTINYLRKVALVGWSFRELSKDRPTVWMPDDHDVYQGNLWGAGGRKITLQEWNSPSGFRRFPCYGAKGGYVQPAEFVKAVERSHTAHLPDPYDPEPIEQGMGVYYTGMKYGGVSFAILEDRKFKSGPLGLVEHESVRPDWITDPDAALAADAPGAELLGQRQLKFLRDWVADWRDVQMKLAVSQTIFCNAATHHGSPNGFLVADLDSNGWPQSGRNAAIDILRRGHAMMLAGDQHLPTLIQHGIEQPHDAGVSFCVPAGAVFYQRWWRPEEIDAMHRTGERHDDRPNTGQYRDGLGNLIDVLAVANPPVVRSAKNRLERGRQRSSGFGVVRMNKAKGTLVAEAWPIGVDPAGADAATSQYPGWPMAFTVADCAGSGNPGLPPVVLHRWGNRPRPVVEVLDADGQLVTMARMTGTKFFPRVFDREGTYTVNVMMPEEDHGRPLASFRGITPRHSRTLDVMGSE
ncbi:MAG: hypothetical protein JW888_10320 [Pirellulales bacterium]|nr:hypothetical protein [Pirellulales bacterium]